MLLSLAKKISTRPLEFEFRSHMKGMSKKKCGLDRILRFITRIKNAAIDSKINFM